MFAGQGVFFWANQVLNLEIVPVPRCALIHTLSQSMNVASLTKQREMGAAVLCWGLACHGPMSGIC